MASRSRHSSRSDRDSDSMEAVKPLVVLVLFGTILYGGYSVVQKGPSSPTEPATSEAPPFTPPPVEVAAAPAPATPPAPSPATGNLPLTAAVAPTAPPPAAVPPPLPAPPAPIPSQASAAPVPALVASPGIIAPPAVPTTPPPAMSTEPPAAMVPAVAAAAGAALGAVATTEAARINAAAPTYLTAESAPPPVQDAVAPLSAPPATAVDRPDRYAALSTSPPLTAGLMPGSSTPPPSSAAAGSSAAFAAAWADAHEKLAAARYAEALAALSIWYDDPSLGLEESQRLEDLLGQLAGTVIYSQQDLLLPPHVVAAGESLPTIAMPLGISWQLLGKINGITHPQDVVPGEHLKVIRGPLDAVVSVSRRRLSLQLGGNYAGSFPVVVGRQFLGRVGSSISVAEIRRGPGRETPPMSGLATESAAKPSIVLGDGLVIEAAEDPGIASEASPSTSLVVSVRDLAELLDILGPGSRVLIRQ
jgi:hypothetical protein